MSNETTNALTSAGVVASTVLNSPASRFPPDVPAASGRLNLNEPSFPPSPKVFEAIRDNASAAGRYPDAQYVALRDALSRKLDVPADRIICGNGSDEILALAGMAFLEPQTQMVLPTPSFPRYAVMAQFAGAALEAVPVRADGACDWKSMLQSCGTQTSILMIATPNNPTGQMLTQDELAELARATPAQTLLVIDEAYFEFAQQAGGCDALDALRKRAGRWLVLRTFSKAYALAGLRIGYGIASGPDVLEYMHRVRTTFHVNALAQIAALAALQDEDYMHEQVTQCAHERERLAQALREIGMPSLPSVANFLAIDCQRQAAPVIQHLAALGLFIGPVGPAHPNYLRVTIGSRDDNDRIIAALTALT